jgi:hypothetical protein
MITSFWEVLFFAIVVWQLWCIQKSLDKLFIQVGQLRNQKGHWAFTEAEVFALIEQGKFDEAAALVRENVPDVDKAVALFKEMERRRHRKEDGLEK